MNSPFQPLHCYKDINCQCKTFNLFYNQYSQLIYFNRLNSHSTMNRSINCSCAARLLFSHLLGEDGECRWCHVDRDWSPLALIFSRHGHLQRIVDHIHTCEDRSHVRAIQCSDLDHRLEQQPAAGSMHRRFLPTGFATVSQPR